MAGRLLVYGANGYTGTLISRLAAEKRLEPVLAGRDREVIAQLASSLGFAHRAFALTDPTAVDEGLDGIAAVLHCAGPFSRTTDPMVQACFRKHVHYLDITGELTVFESHAAKDAQARVAGMMLLSGCGLDIVPSDCLAAHLKSRLPGASHLALGLDAAPWISRGTVKTLIESFHRGMVRENGRLVSLPAGLRTRTIDMGRGPVRGTAVPWGDVSTAYFSTGIPNIEVHVSTRPGSETVWWLMRRLGGVLDLRPVQRLLKAGARFRPPGPTEDQRRSGSTHVWGEAHDGTRVVTSRLRAGGLHADREYRDRDRRAGIARRREAGLPDSVFGLRRGSDPGGSRLHSQRRARITTATRRRQGMTSPSDGLTSRHGAEQSRL